MTAASETSSPTARTFVDRFVRDPFRELAHPPQGQVPALDVLRSVAVLLVILVHTRGLYVEVLGQNSAATNSIVAKYGWSGVDLFFVLSGFLIGKQLWREVATNETVDVKRFILRRGFRIWPLYYAFCFFTLVFTSRPVFPFGRWWQDFFFLSNYFHDELVRGSWSLATEEQFYILTPILLLLGARSLGSVRAYRKYLVAALVLLPILRAITWWRLTGSFSHHDSPLWVERIYLPFHLHADTLVMGLILSNLVTSKDDGDGFMASRWILPIGAVIGSGLALFVQREVFSFTAVALIFGSAARFAISPVARKVPLLDSRFFYVISRLSFGMYLNHRYFETAVLDFCVRRFPLADTHPGLHFAIVYVALATVSALASTVTFCLIEQPFLAWRHSLLDRPKPSPAPSAA